MILETERAELVEELLALFLETGPAPSRPAVGGVRAHDGRESEVNNEIQ